MAMQCPDQILIMKKNMLMLALGMGAGACVYKYMQDHPIKTKKAMQNIKSAIKDLK